MWDVNVGWVEFHETHHEQLVGLAELDPSYERASLKNAVKGADGSREGVDSSRNVAVFD
jgi:hypothetical protein